MAVAASVRLIDALRAVTEALLEALDADAAAISRVLGDALVLVAQSVPAGRTLQLGGGYLVSEFPETAAVLRGGRPRTASVDDVHSDPDETRLLRVLGFGSLLMLPLELRGERWGLVEVYREEPRAFGPVEIRAAAAILADLA
ncbi:MAG TPA: GAF domain-containing protein [Gaiellaceae bacterium]|nr:GAF domain-containing protein [Gaiellaceae bacterium]